jgi:hypothetical protein
MGLAGAPRLDARRLERASVIGRRAFFRKNAQLSAVY